MIEDTDKGFRVTLDDDQRLRAKARLCWFWKYGNLDMPATWNEDQLRQFMAGYDRECKAWLDAQDATKAQEQTKPFQLVDDSALVGRPSLGRLVLSHKPHPEPEAAPDLETQRPNAVIKLTRRD